MTADPGELRARMSPIPQEGGWFLEGPRTEALSVTTVLLDDTPDGFSAFHRLDVEEGWSWEQGGAVELVTVAPDGTLAEELLDPKRPHAVVPAGTWMAARTLGDWSVLTCWCAPAFTPECFTLATREELNRLRVPPAMLTAYTRETTGNDEPR